MRPQGQPRLRFAATGTAVALALALALAPRVAAAAAATGAELSRSEIALDEAAELRVPADGGKQPLLPTVAGLRFERTGQSSEMTSINGSISQHTFILYQVVAARPGTFAIPIRGRTLELKVDPAGAGAPRASASAGAPGTAADEPAQAGLLALLRVTLPKGTLYVGQAVPVTFKAYFRPGMEVTLTGPPSLGIPAFTLSQLSDEPRQGVESIGGVPYRVATWTGQSRPRRPVASRPAPPFQSSCATARRRGARRRIPSPACSTMMPTRSPTRRCCARS